MALASSLNPGLSSPCTSIACYHTHSMSHALAPLCYSSLCARLHLQATEPVLHQSRKARSTTPSNSCGRPCTLVSARRTQARALLAAEQKVKCFYPHPASQRSKQPPLQMSGTLVGSARMMVRWRGWLATRRGCRAADGLMAGRAARHAGRVAMQVEAIIAVLTIDK